MEQESLEEINRNIRSLRNELKEVKEIIEEPYLELDESVVQDVEDSRNSPEEDFVSEEDMEKEFGK
ncbi:MAG: hypothetical protein ABEI74_01440 [Candidatus Pacearchaeota archaeon]